MSKPWSWYNVEDALVDAQSNIYCVGEAGGSGGVFAVWCMSMDMTTRWHATHADYSDDNAHVALDPKGARLVATWEGKHSGVVLSAADGSILGKLGGKQPDDADTYTFDFDDGQWIRFDADGTILALLWNYLARFDGDGKPIPTWSTGGGLLGGKPTKMHPVYGQGHQRIHTDGTLIESVGSHPTNIDRYTNLCMGHDGRVYAERSEHVACWDRTGHRVYRRRLPVAQTYNDCIGADAAGNLYVRAEQRGDPKRRVIVRVSPDGKHVDQIADDRRNGGVIGCEERVVVAPDGRIVLLRHYECMRVLAPDGRLVFQSPHSIEADGEEERNDAKRA